MTVDELIKEGVKYFGPIFMIVVPIIMFIKRLFNDAFIDKIRSKLINDVKDEFYYHSKMFENSKEFQLNEVHSIIFEGEPNKTKIFRKVAVHIISEFHKLENLDKDVIIDNELLSKTFEKAFELIKQDAIKTYGKEKGEILYGFISEGLTERLSQMNSFLYGYLSKISPRKGYSNKLGYAVIDSMLFTMISTIKQQFNSFNGRIEKFVKSEIENFE